MENILGWVTFFTLLMQNELLRTSNLINIHIQKGTVSHSSLERGLLARQYNKKLDYQNYILAFSLEVLNEFPERRALNEALVRVVAQ
jgi:hypothetical protein